MYLKAILEGIILEQDQEADEAVDGVDLKYINIYVGYLYVNISICI